MAYRIENKPVGTAPRRSSGVREFVVALRSLEVGQSFVSDYSKTNIRYTMSVVGHALDRTFRVVKEGESFRVGRIE